MDLKERLSALKGQRGAHATPATDVVTPTLDERLQRLSVRGISNSKRIGISDEEVAARLQGQIIAPGLIRIEHRRSLTEVLGGDGLSGQVMERLALLVEGRPLDPSGLLFLDTETTGLAGGTGTLAFLLGLARIDGDRLHICQWFLTGFKAEATLLDDACRWYGRAQHLVSFNGKAFDVPVLTARYRLARLPEPLSALDHLDLLHPTRRAFGRYWPDCRLQTVEQRLLDFAREDDLPGHLVPEVWTAFVRSGIFDQVPRILHHNLRDLVSLAALLSTLANVYAEPGYARADTLSIARGLRRRGQDEQAYRHLRGRHEDLDPPGLMELADLHRRRRAWDDALEIWRRLAQEGHMLAMEWLAKYYEHVGRDNRAALGWTERLLLSQTDEQRHQKRKARLLQRLGGVI